MTGQIKILNSKLQIPPTAKMLFRKRLFNSLEPISDKKLALVIAGAGYGKTTLVALAVKEKKLNTIWYYLDRSDRDFSVFMSYLIDGIKRYYPAIEEKLSGKIFASSSSGRSRKAFLLDFLSEIETLVSEDIIIVFDDYHAVQESREINETLEFILERLPGNIHLVIISRNEPSLRISRYRAMLEVIDIGEEELGFSIEEIGALFLDRFGIDLNRKKIETLYNKTGGWAASLVLFYNILKASKSGDTDACLLNFEGSSRFVFQYLEENIFEGLPAEIQEFLIKTSLLSRLDTDFCDAYLNIESSARSLQELEEKHLFTFPYEDNGKCYYYHHLFKEFLNEKLHRDFGKKDIKKLHFNIAKLLEERGEEFEALHHFIEGGHYEEAGEIIGKIEFHDLVTIPLSLVVDSLNRIPVKFINKDPRILYIRAKLVSINGRVKEAIAGFKLALEKFRKDGAEDGIANCLKELGLHYYLTGNIRGAKKQMEELLAQDREVSFLTIEIYVYLIVFTSLLGKLDEADQHYKAAQKAESVFYGMEKEMIRVFCFLGYSFRFYVSGDFSRSQDLNLKTLEAITQLGFETFFPLTCYQCAATAYFQGEFLKGYEYAQKGIAIAEKNGIFDHQYAWLLHARACNNLGQKKYNEVMADADESLNIFREADHYWGQASVYELLGCHYLKTGNIKKAEDKIETGLNTIKGLKLTLTEGMLLVCNVDIIIEKENYTKAVQVLKKARKKVSVSDYYTFRVHLLAARLSFKEKKESQGLKELEAGLKIAKLRDYDTWLIKENRWVVSHIVELYSNGVLKKYCKKIISRMKGDAQESLYDIRTGKSRKLSQAAGSLLKSLIPAEHPALRICLLGKFRVFIDEKEIPAEKWKNTKAAKLFKYLAYRRNHGFISKEVLLELVWPEEDTQKTGKRMHVALSALRKILEPGLKRGAQSSYIIKQKDSYRLEIQDKGTIDVEKFIKELELADNAEKKKAEESLRHYLNAESYYQGMFLEADLYDDWCLAEKEMLNEKYLHVLKNIIQCYEGHRDFSKCIEYANKYLNCDKYAENIYRSLMKFYSITGENSRVVLTFEKCRQNIEQDLSCPLSKETLSLYDKLLQARS